MTIAWAVLCAGDLPWIQGPAASVIWFVATISLLFEFLEAEDEQGRSSGDRVLVRCDGDCNRGFTLWRKCADPGRSRRRGCRAHEGGGNTILAAAGLFAFLVFDYLHDVTDPIERISWTWTRTSLPILSFLILSAGIATFGKGGDARSASGTLVAGRPSSRRDIRSVLMISARVALLWIAGTAALLIAPILYWVKLPIRDLGVPATPVARINQMFSDQLLLLDQAEELIPKGASFSVSAFDRDAEMSLFMFALSEVLDRYPMPMSYYGTATPQLGGRARYLVSYRCETLEPNLKLLGRFPQGCVFERQR